MIEAQLTFMQRMARTPMTAVVRAPGLAALALALGLAACSTLQEADPTGLLGESETVEPEQVKLPATDADAGYPNLASVPQEPPRRPSRKAEREALKAGLAADRANAIYSDQPLRAESEGGAPARNGAGRAATGPDEPGSPPERPAILAEAPAEPAMPQQPAAPSAQTTPDATPAADPLDYATSDVPAPASKPSRQPAAPSEADGEGEPTGAGNTGTSGDTQTAPTAEPEPAGDVGGESAETQTAALPPPDAVLPEPLRLSFEGTEAALSPQAQKDLATLAGRLESNTDARIEIRAFATPTDDTGSAARRLSLKRALAVRAFLAERGVRSTRMDVRALGGDTDKTPRDRVDIVAAEN